MLPIFAGSFALVLGVLASLGWRFDPAPMFVGFALSVAWLTGVLMLVADASGGVSSRCCRSATRCR